MNLQKTAETLRSLRSGIPITRYDHMVSYKEGAWWESYFVDSSRLHWTPLSFQDVVSKIKSGSWS